MKHVSQISFDFKWDDKNPYNMKEIEQVLLAHIPQILSIYGMDCNSMDEEYQGALK